MHAVRIAAPARAPRVREEDGDADGARGTADGPHRAALLVPIEPRVGVPVEEAEAAVGADGGVEDARDGGVGSLVEGRLNRGRVHAPFLSEVGGVVKGKITPA